MAKSSNKILYVLAALVVLLVIGAIVAKKQGWIGKEKPLEVTAAEARHGQIIEKVSASGKVQPVTEVKISPDVSGEITELHVKEGDSVVRGQLLLKIRPDTYESMVEMQEAGVNTARANLAQARARLSQAKANNLQAQQTFARNKDLYQSKVISQADFESSQTQLEVSKQELQSAVESVRAAEFGVQNAAAQLKQSRENLNKTTIFAPVSGIISKLSVEKGERVVGTSQMAGTELLRIANLQAMEVRVNVNENDIVRVALGDTALIEVDSYSGRDQKFKGVVTSIANTAKDALTLEAVTEFEVRMRLLNQTYRHLVRPGARYPFRPGMTASVDIITERKNNVLMVPLAAVTTRTEDELSGKNRKDKKGGFGPPASENEKETKEKERARKDEEVLEVVFVNQAGIAKVRKVKTGISDLDNIEITEGLREGDEVITGPFRVVSKQLEDAKPVDVKAEGSLNKKAIKAEEGSGNE